MVKRWRLSFFGFYGTPDRREVNERGATLDLGGWHLTCLLHALLAVRLCKQHSTGLALACLSYTVAAAGMAALIRCRRAVYVQHRELLTSAANAHHTAMWLHLVLQGGVPLFALHAGRPLRLLGLLAVANSSLLTMIYFTHGRMTLPSMRRLLPLLALQPLARGVPMCRCLLREAGAHAPIRVLYRVLAAGHDAALLPFASPATVPDPRPLYACLAVNAWLVLAVSVALPLALLQLLERRAPAAPAEARQDRQAGQQAQATRVTAPRHDAVAVAWPMRAYLSSSLVWCAVGLGLQAWQAAAPSSLAGTA